MHNQLDIFSPKTEALTQAWQQMAAFDFQASHDAMAALLRTEPSDPELLEICSVCERWRDKLTSETNPEVLLHCLGQEPLLSGWGYQVFRRAVIKHIIVLAKSSGIFRFNVGGTVADLHLLVDEAEKAEQEITEQLSGNNENSFLYARLADVQWHNEKYTEARSNYLLALLLDAENIDTDRLANKVVKHVLEHYGCELAAPWCYIHGEPLPIAGLIAQDPTRFVKLRAFKACVLLAEADLAAKSGSPEVGKIRKRLHDLDSGLFTAYRAKIMGGSEQKEIRLS